MLDTVISKPVYRVLANLTQEPRLEVALPLAVKDWVRLRLAEARSKKHSFEQRYEMVFAEFERAWREGRIADAHSYEGERDYWEWEASMTDEARLVEMTESLEPHMPLEACVQAAKDLSYAGSYSIEHEPYLFDPTDDVRASA